VSEQPADDVPAIVVVRGTPSAQEVAALVVVLAAPGGDETGGNPAARPSLWASGGRARTTSPAPGAGAWRASALPH
jgi:hypothetical protein